MAEEFLMPVVMTIAVAVLGSFALGTQWNIRKGDQVLRWLTEGLPLIGERTTYRWLGSSVLELKIAKANAPFRNAETLVVFEPRDILLLWWWSRLRGRRDLMIFRAQLTAAPGFELEIFDPTAWTTHQSERDLKNKQWTQFDLPANPTLRAYHSAKADLTVIPRLVNLATHLDGTLARISVHRDLPNLEIHWRLPDLKTKSAHDPFVKLQQIAAEILRR